MYTRWHKDTRYYETRLTKDMFGHWCIVAVWGRINSRLGNAKNITCDTPHEARRQFERINKRRLQRGYLLIKSQVYN